MKTKASKPAPRVRVNMYLDADQKAALDKLTEQTRVPWAEYVREGVGMVLAKYRTRKTRGSN